MPDTSPTPSSSTDNTIRVMVVDDSTDTRAFITKLFNTTPGVLLNACAADGRQAIDMARKIPIDVIILDTEMPGMDGLTALPFLLNIAPKAHIILISDTTNIQAIMNIRALVSKSCDYVKKPLPAQPLEAFGKTLVDTILSYPANTGNYKYENTSPVIEETPAITLKKRPKFLVPQAIAIGSSTGGPEALVKLFKNMMGQIKYSPVFITQHLPPSFSSLLASHIQSACGNLCIQPEDGQPVEPGNIYLAPGDVHMECKKNANGQINIHLTKAPPEHFCRPSVNPMLRSLVEVYDKHVLAIILTGMGHDGLEGCKVVSEAGGIILAQDRETSVVWGMPGSVATQGLCTAVLPLDSIASHIRTIMGSRL